MTLDEVMDEMLAVHEALRRLHFLPEEIFVGVDDVKYFIQLRADGQEFSIEIGPRSAGEFGLFERLWPIRVAWWNKNATTAERDKLYRKSKVFTRAGEIVSALIRRGVQLRSREPVRA